LAVKGTGETEQSTSYEAAAFTAEPDESLVRRVCAGETACFELLMRRHNERIYRTVRAVLGDDADAEDVMQQAYVSAYQHLAAFEGRARFSTWLTRIAINEAYARLRKRRRSLLVSDAPPPPWDEDATANDEPESSGPTPEQIAARVEMQALLERAVDTLSVPNRMVFVLRSIEGLSTAETAACLDISEEAVKTRLHRANEALRLWLAEQMGGAVQDAFRFYRPRCDAVVRRVMARLIH
jgi:RNA polymerase sigma-70 factor (ECF subfamily)